MTRAQQLVFCKKCIHRSLDFHKGLLCGLTQKPADFDKECPNFKIDSQSTYVPKPKEAIKPNTQRAKWAQILIWINLGIGILSLISSLLQYRLLDKVNKGHYVDENTLLFNDLREGLLGIALLIVYLISVVTFIRWFRRAYYNLNNRVLNPMYAEGWGAGAWFVPILNLFRPYQIMKEIDSKTGLLIEKRRQKPIASNNTLIGFWWALWIINGVFGRYILKLNWRAQTVPELLEATTANLIGSCFDIPLCILAALTVKAVSEKEDILGRLEEEANFIEKTLQ